MDTRGKVGKVCIVLGCLQVTYGVLLAHGVLLVSDQEPRDAILFFIIAAAYGVTGLALLRRGRTGPRSGRLEP